MEKDKLNLLLEEIIILNKTSSVNLEKNELLDRIKNLNNIRDKLRYSGFSDTVLYGGDLIKVISNCCRFYNLTRSLYSSIIYKSLNNINNNIDEDNDREYFKKCLSILPEKLYPNKGNYFNKYIEKDFLEFSWYIEFLENNSEFKNNQVVFIKSLPNLLVNFKYLILNAGDEVTNIRKNKKLYNHDHGYYSEFIINELHKGEELLRNFNYNSINLILTDLELRFLKKIINILCIDINKFINSVFYNLSFFMLDSSEATRIKNFLLCIYKYNKL